MARKRKVRGIKAICPLNVRHKVIWVPSQADSNYVVAICDKCGVRAVCRSVSYKLVRERQQPKRERSK
jgi:hypothetical protein